MYADFPNFSKEISSQMPTGMGLVGSKQSKNLKRYLVNTP